MGFYHRRDRLDLNLRFQGRIQVCLVAPRALQGCKTFWHLWATMEEEELSWATH